MFVTTRKVCFGLFFPLTFTLKYFIEDNFPKLNQVVLVPESKQLVTVVLIILYSSSNQKTFIAIIFQGIGNNMLQIVLPLSKNLSDIFSQQYRKLLYYTILYFIILHFTILYYTTLHYTVLYYCITLTPEHFPALALSFPRDAVGGSDTFIMSAVKMQKHSANKRGSVLLK